MRVESNLNYLMSSGQEIIVKDLIKELCRLEVEFQDYEDDLYIVLDAGYNNVDMEVHI